jgi:hypothetical protein
MELLFLLNRIKKKQELSKIGLEIMPIMQQENHR